jgi:N-acetylglutamate synthase
MTEPASIVAFERIAAAHWRGTEEEWLGDWLLRAAEGFTGRANSALPLGDPRLPPDEAIDAVTRWYRDRELRPMIALSTPLEAADPTTGQPTTGPFGMLDRQLTERGWQTRQGPAYVMVADLPLGAPAAALPPGREVRASADPDDAWAARYHYPRVTPARTRRTPVIGECFGNGFGSGEDFRGRSPQNPPR